MLSRDPVLQELNRRMVAERGVAATPAVEDFDVIEQVRDGLFSRRVACAVHPFILQAVGEALRGSVVPAVCLATHRAVHPVLGKFARECKARVLTSPVRVMNQSRGSFLNSVCEAVCWR